MESASLESTSLPSQKPSCSGDAPNDAADFECNICLELAQDPIVTLCGHLFCWPCLYKWLHYHSQCQECPVCKALIEEEKLVPLYGRGKNREDPRSKPIPGMEIPHRPAGQRPETAVPPDANQFFPPGFNMMRGGGFTGGAYAPAPTARFGNIALSAAFGGLIPALLNIQVHNFTNGTVFGSPSPGYPYAFPMFHGGHGHGFGQPPTTRQDRQDNFLKNLLLLFGFLVILAVIYM